MQSEYTVFVMVHALKYLQKDLRNQYMKCNPKWVKLYFECFPSDSKEKSVQNLPFLVTQKLSASTICLRSTTDNHFRVYVYFSELVPVLSFKTNLFKCVGHCLCVVLSDAFIGLVQELSLHWKSETALKEKVGSLLG